MERMNYQIAGMILLSTSGIFGNAFAGEAKTGAGQTLPVVNSEYIYPKASIESLKSAILNSDFGRTAEEKTGSGQLLPEENVEIDLTTNKAEIGKVLAEVERRVAELPEIPGWSGGDIIVAEENKEYILLSNDIYGLSDIENPKGRVVVHEDRNYEILDYTDNKGSGFTAGTFKDLETGKIIVVYGGTFAGEGVVNDLYQDLLSIPFTDSYSTQYVEALNYIDKISGQNEESAKRNNIEITGHSLGGGLASYAGLKSGFKTVTINAAPITLSERGFHALGESGRNRLLHSSEQKNISNIRSLLDPVSISSDILGYTRLLGVKTNQLLGQPDFTINTTPGTTTTIDSWFVSPVVSSLYGPLYSVIESHKLAPLIDMAFPEEVGEIKFFTPAKTDVYYEKTTDIIYMTGNEEDSEEVESITLVNQNIKPTQAELDAKAKEQLIIASNLASSNRSLNALNSQLQNKKEELIKLEAQTGSFNEAEYHRLKSLKTFYFQAKFLNKKYNGNISDIRPEDMQKLIMLAKNTLGSGREWRYLFTNSYSLYDDTYRRYLDISKDRKTSATNITHIAQLRERISRLEQAIIPKRNENTEYQIQKHDIDFITMNLTDAANDDYNVILAAEQNPTPTTTTSEWTGGYTRVYYNENLGDLYFFGYGDGPAETKEIKPGNGSTLYLHPSGDGTGDERTRILSESEAAYFGNYSYTAWGTWSDPNATNKIYTSHWVVTDQTPDVEMPKQGSATYQGKLAGGQWTLGQTGYNAVNGNINLNADFGSGVISGNLTVKNASTGATWGTASISNGSIGDSGFGGQLVGAGISNTETWHSQIHGDFGGKSAAETGGVWAITKGTGNNGDERAVGVFRAKKQ
ncbi:MAG: transferrin-binding protein-like solute binding protein [Desulfobulbaceae bacterium]|nr:transferrin-binding protein-like solute binding protein [Desulfobulbaceae bacterium]